MAQSVFNRIEKKYLLPETLYLELMDQLKHYMTIDCYGLHTICNIYYDTPDHLLIRRSIEKPKYKEKLRLRSYGVPSLDSKVFLEIKKKYKKVVNKRRLDFCCCYLLCNLPVVSPAGELTDNCHDLSGCQSKYYDRNQ